MNNDFFGKIAEIWYENRKKTVKETSLNRYRTVLDKYLIPKLKDMKVGDIGKAETENLFISFLDKYSINTLGLVFSVLKSIIFESTGEILYKPLFLLKSKRRTESLTKEEVVMLESFLIRDNSLHDLGIRLALIMGLRIGEICALKWQNINLAKKSIVVLGTMQRVSVHEKGKKTAVKIFSPKTEASYREIPIPPILYKTLKEKQCNDECYLLTGKADRFVEPRVLQYAFSEISQKILGRKIRFHALRHTFATDCISKKIDLKTVSQIMGHSSVIVTLNIYRDVCYDDMMKAVQTMERYVSR